MRNVIFLIALSILIGFLSCDKDEDNGPKSIYFEEIEWQGCQPEPGDDLTSYIIQNQTDYEAFKLLIIQQNNDCLDINFPNIDFDAHSLIGIQVSGSGCEVEFDRNFLIDNENGKYIYRINATFTGACYMYLIDFNWILVDKLNDNYAVNFDVEITYEVYETSK